MKRKAAHCGKHEHSSLISLTEKEYKTIKTPVGNKIRTIDAL